MVDYVKKLCIAIVVALTVGFLLLMFFLWLAKVQAHQQFETLCKAQQGTPIVGRAVYSDSICIGPDGKVIPIKGWK